MNVYNIPIFDETDSIVIMHRNAHFSGSFSDMFKYYKAEGKGAQAEITLQQIEKLRYAQNEFGYDLSECMLSSDNVKTVERSLKLYDILKQSCSINQPIQSLVAKLILSEDAEPEKEIKDIVSQGQQMYPYLIRLFESEDFIDPVFPGYGLGPELAVKCLGLIGNSSVLPILFGKIGKMDFFIDDAILEAIKRFGSESETFLLRMLCSTPFSEDNEKAALALVHFKNSYRVATTAFNILKSQTRPYTPSFLNYLTIISEGLIGTDLEKDFYNLSNETTLPRIVREDILEIKDSWTDRNKF